MATVINNGVPMVNGRLVAWADIVVLIGGEPITGIVGGELFKHVDEGPYQPTLGATPCVLRLSGGLVGPELLARFVPGVAVKAGGGVVGMTGYVEELVGDVVEDVAHRMV